MLLREALIYLDMGWCVYPAHHVNGKGRCSCGDSKCSAPGKHPVGSWADYQHRLPAETEVRSWFGTLECNVGMVTGQISGVAVVDVDGEKGRESAAQLNLKPTLIAKTGSGGYHLYYQLRTPFPSKVGIRPGIDLRADGGFVVLPPSSHKSGNRYMWYDIRRPATFPVDLFRSMRGPSLPDDWTADVLEGVTEGMRSNTAVRLSGRYFAKGLSLGEVWILMTAWNDRNDPPLKPRELKRTVKWAHDKHVNSQSTAIRIETLQQLQDALKGANGD